MSLRSIIINFTILDKSPTIWEGDVTCVLLVKTSDFTEYVDLISLGFCLMSTSRYLEETPLK